jgi:hypothetical protein
VRAFIGVNVRTCMSICVYTAFLKKRIFSVSILYLFFIFLFFVTLVEDNFC